MVKLALRVRQVLTFDRLLALAQLIVAIVGLFT